MGASSTVIKPWQLRSGSCHLTAFRTLARSLHYASPRRTACQGRLAHLRGPETRCPGRGLLNDLQTLRRAALACPHSSQDLDDDDLTRFGEALDYHEYKWVRELINKHLGEPTLTPAPHAAAAAP